MKKISGYIGRLRRYYVAVQELSNLTDRELADLGMQRRDISKIAYETALSR